MSIAKGRQGDGGLRPVTLPNDGGEPLKLMARLVAKDTYFNQSSGVLTVERLFRTSEGCLGYGVISAFGERRERRAYCIEETEAGVVRVNTGSCRLDLPLGDLCELLAMALQADEADAPTASAGFRPAANVD